MRVIILLPVLALMGCAAEPSVYFPNNPFQEADCGGLSISHDIPATECMAGMEEIEAEVGPVTDYRETWWSESPGWALMINRQTGTGRTVFIRLPITDLMSGTPADDMGYRWDREREYGAYKYIRYAVPRLFSAPESNKDPAACFYFVRYTRPRPGGAGERVSGFYCKQSTAAIPIKEVEDILSKIKARDYRTAN